MLGSPNWAPEKRKQLADRDYEKKMQSCFAEMISQTHLTVVSSQ